MAPESKVFFCNLFFIFQVFYIIYTKPFFVLQYIDFYTTVFANINYPDRKMRYL